MADWLSRKNHNENKDEEIEGMQIGVNAKQLFTNIPECMTFNKLKQVTKTNYSETSEHNGHSKMTWQLLME